MCLPTRTDREGYFCLPKSRHTEVHTMPEVNGPSCKGDNDPTDPDCTNHFENISFSVTDHSAYAVYFFKEINF